MNDGYEENKGDALVFTSGDGSLTINIPRRLSEKESRMVNNAVDTVRRVYPDNKDMQKFVIHYAVRAILCSESAWPELVLPVMQAYRSAGTKADRNKALLGIEGLIIGMVHVYEVRHNVHRGTDIALYIDLSTRPTGYDAMPGIFSKDFAYRIIARLYTK